MSQKNSEILGDEWIALLLAESEYPGLMPPEDSLKSENSFVLENSILPEDFLALEGSLKSEDSFVLENSILPENSLALEDSLDSRNPIFSQEIEVDSLTGMPKVPKRDIKVTPLTPVNTTVTTLKDASLRIEPSSPGVVKVTAAIKVELDPVTSYSSNSFRLQASAWGIDAGFLSFLNNGNDHLFNFPSQTITSDRTYTFEAEVSSSALNEDHRWLNRDDEIGVAFTLTRGLPPVNVNQAMSPIVTGHF